jgi:DNA-binding protein H-NS
MDAKIPKMREKLAQHREKISEMEARAAEMEKEIQQAEEEQLSYLARLAANTLSGGMDELFEVLKGLRANPGSAANANPKTKKDYVENKEGETVYGFNETNG